MIILFLILFLSLGVVSNAALIDSVTDQQVRYYYAQISDGNAVLYGDGQLMFDAYYLYVQDHPEDYIEISYNNGFCFNHDKLKNEMTKQAGQKFLGSIDRSKSQGNTAYQIYKKLISETVYEHYPGVDQTAYSALVMKRTVCAGYTKAFNYLCRICGIDALYVDGYLDGTPHAWSCIRLDRWYYVDVTNGRFLFKDMPLGYSLCIDETDLGFRRWQNLRPVVDGTLYTEDNCSDARFHLLDGLRYEIKGNHAEVCGYIDNTKKKIVVPDNIIVCGRLCKVTKVQSYAFFYYSNLRTVVLGKHIKTLGYQSLWCKNLKKVIYTGKKPKVHKKAMKANVKLKRG